MSVDSPERDLHLTRFALENAPDPVYWVRPDASFSYVNRAACESLGYSRGELLAMTVHDIAPAFSAAQWPSFWPRIREAGTLTTEGNHLRKDGGTFPVEVRLSYQAFEGQEYICAFARDVSERRQAERERRINRLTLERTPDPIFWLNPDASFFYVNQAACESLGYTRDELLALSVPDVDPEYSAEMWPRFWSTQREVGHATVESTHLRKDGSTFSVELRLSHQAFEDQEYVCAFAIDITELRRAQEEREAVIAELEAKNTELERFTYTVSHDLKAPLVTIRGFLGLLEKDAVAGRHDRVRDDIARITSATDTMRQLLEELLELSRIGRVVYPSEEVELDSLARKAVDLLAGSIAERGIEVVIRPRLGTAVGDRPRLLEVYQNLLANAVKFMGDAARPRVEIGARHDPDETVYYVRDNGIGIEPRFHDKVFGLFERLDPGVEGTGIGLALVKRIVEVHDGRVWVESEGKGTGSTFCFTLPEETLPEETLPEETLPEETP